MARTSRRLHRLPNAPLAEVVFELRWALQGSPGAPPVLRADPGFLPLLDSFTSRIKRAGFSAFKDMSPALQTGAHGVARRFFKAADSPFPIMQIGPGIFATNESSLYEWSAFKKQVAVGIRALLSSYPKLEFFKIEPMHIELRYVDAFDKSILGDTALLRFIQHGTSLKLELPRILTDKNLFVGDTEGRMVIRRKLKGCKNSEFIMDIGSGQRNEKEKKEDIVRMETRVISKDPDAPSLRNGPQFMRAVDEWLERAHGITSPFFREFVAPAVMKKFEGH